MKMKKLKNVSLLGFMAVFTMLSACSAVRLSPEAIKVRLTNQEPKGCEYLGEISGSQGNAISGGWTSNDNLAEGARNDLKNRAAKLGANVVHILASRDSTTYGGFGVFGGSKTSSNMEGVAYKCPAQ
jgi:hypothetical protein